MLNSDSLVDRGRWVATVLFKRAFLHDPTSNYSESPCGMQVTHAL